MPSEKPSRTPHPFDVATVEKLIDLMADHDLSEIDLHDGDSRIRLRKGGKVSVAPIAVAPSALAPSHATAPVAHAPGSPSTHATDNKKYHVIVSPTPGTFYAKPGPDDSVFVKVGSKVAPDTVVCKIEAMKIFNDIAAECTGTIVEIMVDNAQPVEYGQPLFRVEI